MNQLIHSKRFFIFSFLFLTLCVQETFAQTARFVNDASTVGDLYTTAVGSVGGTGTSSSPYLTIAAANTAAVAGDVIYVDAGTYTQGALTIKAGVRVIGLCPASSIINLSNSASSTLTLSSNTELSKFTVTRQAPGAAGGQTSIAVATITGGTNMKINNCLFTKCRTAVYINSTTAANAVLIENNDFDDNRTGIILPDATYANITIRGNNINNNRTFGLLFNGNTALTNIKVENNNLTGNLASQLEANGSGSAGAITLINNWFGNAAPVVYVGSVNGGFTVDDHNVVTAYPYNFTDANGGAAPNYPNDISGSNTAAFNVVSHAVASNSISLPACCVVTSDNPVVNYPTIKMAITGSNPGAIITLCSGMVYDEQVLANKSLTLKSAAGPQAIIRFSGTPTGKKTLIDVSSQNVTIENINIKVDLTKFSSGIIASATNINNLTIKDNVIEAIGTSNAASTGTFGDRNAISINYSGTTNFRIAAGGVSNVLVQGNTVTGVNNDGFGVSRYFRSGVSLDEGGGTITGNNFKTISHDVLVRFGSNGNVNVTNNTCNGGGVEFSDMNAGAGILTVSGNTFNSAFSTDTASIGSAILRLKNNYHSKVTNVDGNTFSAHQWAVSLENHNTVTVSNNLFTPKAGSTTYRHITVNTKSISTNSNAIVQVQIGAEIRNNTFNGSGVNGGYGVSFLNHDSDNASFGSFEVHENSFDVTTSNTIFQDSQTGASNTATFPTYNTLIGVGAPAITTMAPWTANVNATCNWFGSNDPSVVASTVTGNTDYIPYLSSGTDADGAIGFQTAESCSVCNTTAGIDNNSGTTVLNCSVTSIEVTATGGLYYEWSNGLGNNANASIGASGTYFVTVTSGDGCTDVASIEITDDYIAPVAGITNNSGSTEVSCNMPAISLTATGGVSYQWSNGLGNDADAEVTAAGEYTVTVTASNGCTSTATIEITSDLTPPGAVIINNTGTTELTCTVLEIELTATGDGTYEWSTGSTDADVTINTAGTYSLTVTGSNGCTSVTSVEITSNTTLPTATITVSGTDFCSYVTLTANSAPANTYYWTGGSITGATTASVNLGVGDPDGVYTVTVTDPANGCFIDVDYIFTKQDFTNVYTLLATKDIKLGQLNVVNGAVGNTTAGKKVTIDKNSTVNGFVKASVINLGSPVTVTGGTILSPAAVTLPSMLTNTATVPPANFSVPDNAIGVVINDNYNNLTIGKKAEVTVNGNIYGKIQLKEGAQVTFTSNDISINELNMDNGKAGVNYTTANFDGSVVRVKSAVTIGDRCKVNSAIVTFYMADASPDAEKFNVHSNDTWVTANVYMLKGTLAVKGKTGNCTMTGMYICENISSEHNVSWNGYDCGGFNLSSAYTGVREYMKTEDARINQLNSDLTEPMIQNQFDVIIYPNPSSDAFSLLVNGLSDEMISVRIFNAISLMEMRSQVSSTSISQLGNELPGGTYHVEVIQGNYRKVVKWIKMDR